MSETVETTEKTQEELEQEKQAKAAARKKKVKEIGVALKCAFKLELKEAKSIIAGIQGKLSPAELASLVEAKVLTAEQKEICVAGGLQKSASARTSISHALPYLYKNFRPYDAANREVDEFPDIAPDAGVIAAVTNVSKAMEKFYEDNKKDLDFLQEKSNAILKTYFRFVKDDEETE